MVAKFTVFGSCNCRDIFNSNINKGYKDFFSILGFRGVRLSFISIMQDPVNYDSESIKLPEDNEKNVHISEWIKNDLDKVFLKDLVELDIEYLLMDTYYDTDFGIVDIGNGKYITNSEGLENTKFFKNLKYKRILTIDKNYDEYFAIWKKHCDLFFDFVKLHCPNIKIILNTTRHVSTVLKADGSEFVSDHFKSIANRLNPYRDKFDEYILKNFDVDVLTFDENLRAYENYIWGCNSLHYEYSYFMDMTNQLNDIVKRNSLLDNPKYDFLNKEFRHMKREILLSKIQLRNNSRKNKYLSKQISNLSSQII